VAGAGGLAAWGAGWLTPVGAALAEQARADRRREPARSVILLWMSGGPSQLETFDPHPGKMIAGDAKAIDTAVKGLKFDEHYPRLAERAGKLAVVRSMVTKEGDHERGTITVKTGRIPDPTLAHPSIGAVACHELPGGGTEIPRHISIMPNQWPGRGGWMGAEYDAFKTWDPKERIPDVTPRVEAERDRQRSADLDVVERAYARGRRDTSAKRAVTADARRMMGSEQLAAFDVSKEPESLRAKYGDTPFGRGCLAARRLIETGVRCVEVTLEGWDTHAENLALCARQAGHLDPAFSALLDDLAERDLLRRTVVICAGEFGRTPKINPLGGRDHWATGFSVVLAGGGVRGGAVIGATDPEGGKEPADPQGIGDLHATVLAALGIDHSRELETPIGRPMKLADGKPIKGLLEG
jgi:hypothetical protein